MTSIITGDIIHSQKASPTIWLNKLKSELNALGRNPETWEIYRGDSFQVEITDPSLALLTSIKIKAAIKCIKHIDVRLAIGIGDKTYQATNITESNGSAFVNSGDIFESLVKKKQNLAISTPSVEFNKEMNLLFRLALIAMDNWTINSAEMIHLTLSNPGYSQKELGKMLGIKQNAVSNRLKRAYYDEISELIKRYQNKIKEIT
ncbi:MAG: hypothetical protein JXA77_09375 [Bacteroidales bacterium]|nr:hypothetical protein [Bacteroidales bacterium]MBN2817379.1 hypothetical protein [Bacteroidales bacterium]